MSMTKERRPTIRTMRGWAIHVLQEAGAIRECEEHGWMQDRADPHAQERAFNIAREDPPVGISPDAAAAEVRYVLNSIGDTCPELYAELRFAMRLRFKTNREIRFRHRQSLFFR